MDRNWAEDYGGSISAYGRIAIVENCVISGTSGFGPNLALHMACELRNTQIVGGRTLGSNFYDPDLHLIILGEGAFVENCLIAHNDGTGIERPIAEVVQIGPNSRIVQSSICNNSGAYNVIDCAAGVSLEKCVVAFNIDATAVSGEAITANCSDIFANSGGDWVGPATGQLGLNGNISSDPLFCDTSANIYSLLYTSPCRPESTSCGLMGALPVGCAGAVASSLVVQNEVPDHVASQSPTLAWSVSAPFVQAMFRVEVGSDADWLTAEMWQPGPVTSPDTFAAYLGSTLTEGSTYFARVQVGDGTVWSYWTETSFRMNTTPPPAVQISPIDLAEVDTALPTFRAVVLADAEGDSQQVQLAIYIDDSNLIEGSPLLPVAYAHARDTVEWTPTAPLNENSFYSWIMRSWDGFEYSEWNWDGMESFGVNAQNEAPQAVTLYDPQGDSIVYNQHPEFSWTPSDDSDPFDTVFYDFRVSIDSLFLFGLEDDGLSDTDYATAIPLEAGRRFWWKVDSRDNHNLSTLSSVEQFRTYSPGDVEGSWSVSAVDVITLVNFIFKGASLSVPTCAGDVNGIAGVSAADIIYLVNYVFRGGPTPTASCSL